MGDRAVPDAPALPRGRLHVFLGAAPGVGKTFAMLREARRLAGDGHDVVIGYVETHGRGETEAEIGDLEIVPRATWRYRGIQVEELDVDAVIARHPEIVLVDELAHANAPGSAREKRYQDVELLRDAGIDVYTTVNIQHLEGVHDIVTSITGVEVRERIPDAVVADATDIQLVDLPVETLLDRFAQGKIYPRDRAQQALANFFREGSLTALRELALRQTAVGVDARLNRFMMVDQPAMADPVSERVVVVMDAAPAWGNVLRNAWRLASGLRGELLVAVLTPAGDIDQPGVAAAAVRRHRQLAEDLGARVVVIGHEPGEIGQASQTASLVELLRRERATVLVAGVSAPARRRWRVGRVAALDASLPLEAIAATAGVDAYLVVMRDHPEHASGRDHGGD